MRTTQILSRGWKFRRGEQPGAEAAGFDDSGWESVRLPHDWAISGPFAAENDLQVTRIMQDGEMEETRHYGRTGALPHIGTGFYRNVLEIPAEWAGKAFRLEFDGVMSHATVRINGREAGGRAFGYSSFAVDATGLLEPGAERHHRPRRKPVRRVALVSGRPESTARSGFSRSSRRISTITGSGLTHRSRTLKNGADGSGSRLPIPGPGRRGSLSRSRLRAAVAPPHSNALRREGKSNSTQSGSGRRMRRNSTRWKSNCGKTASPSTGSRCAAASALSVSMPMQGCS